MSTRKASFITVDELVDEVGTDALRFFFLMRKADAQLEFGFGRTVPRLLQQAQGDGR